MHSYEDMLGRDRRKAADPTATVPADAMTSELVVYTAAARREGGADAEQAGEAGQAKVMVTDDPCMPLHKVEEYTKPDAPNVCWSQ